jgi:hypothetical protein
MVRWLDYQNENFNTQWTMPELMKLAAFSFSEQGGRVHECADSWPDYLLDAVLAAEEGALIDEAIVQRASEAAA